jgi:hypothetical protein
MRRDAKLRSVDDIDRRTAIASLRSCFIEVDRFFIWIRRPGEESAPRLCRYEPSLSNQSNRWGQPWQQQAYRSLALTRFRPCSNAADSARPRGYDLGSKGIQVAIEHCRGRHFKIGGDRVRGPVAGILQGRSRHDPISISGDRLRRLPATCPAPLHATGRWPYSARP